MIQAIWSCLFLLISLGMTNSQVLSQSIATYTIRGEVRNSTGGPVPGALVCTVQDQRRVCVHGDSDGRFTIGLTAAGNYKIILGDVPTRLNPGSFMPSDEYPASQGQDVTLDGANPEANVTLTMPAKNGVLLVKAVDVSTRLPIELALIRLCPADMQLRCGGLYFRSDIGEYRVYVPPAPFDLIIRSPDYQEWSLFGDQNTIVQPETSRTLQVELQRLSKAAGEALSEREKQPGINLPAPAQLAPAENEKFVHFPRTTTLKWDKVDGAVSYEVEVDYCLNSQVLAECLSPTPLVFSFDSAKPSSPITGTMYTFDFIGTQPGRWRVWAVDEIGRRGFKSPWRMFFYVPSNISEK